MLNPVTTSPVTPQLPPLTLCELQDPKLPGIQSYSPFCLKAHRMLRAAGLPYERRHVDRPSQHGDLNPTAQVPILLVGNEVVPDSTAIAHRIEALAPGRLNRDPQPEVVAEAWLWEEFADTALNGYLVAARWADDANWPLTRRVYFGGMPAPLQLFIPGKLRKHVVKSLVARDVWRAGPQACWQRFGALLDQLDTRLSGRTYWVGAALSVADVAIFAQLASLRTPLTPGQHAEVERRPHLRAWMERIDRETA